jgi:hypothetical protein
MTPGSNGGSADDTGSLIAAARRYYTCLPNKGEIERGRNNPRERERETETLLGNNVRNVAGGPGCR